MTPGHLGMNPGSEHTRSRTDGDKVSLPVDEDLRLQLVREEIRKRGEH